MSLVQRKDDHQGTVGYKTSPCLTISKRRRSSGPEPPLDMHLEARGSYSTGETGKYFLLFDIIVRVYLKKLVSSPIISPSTKSSFIAILSADMARVRNEHSLKNLYL